MNRTPENLVWYWGGDVLKGLKPEEKPTVRCLWTRGWRDYEIEVRDIYLVYVKEDMLIGNTDGEDDWGRVLIEDQGYHNDEKYFFVATEPY